MSVHAKGLGLLLVGHGSRETIGTEQFLAVAAAVAGQAAPLAVEPCFLEFAEPTIETAFRRLVERGASRVVVVPVLLFAAGHAKRDIPQEVARVAAGFPEVEVRQTEHLGCHPRLLELSALRFAQALGERPGDRPTLLVLAGRGSHDSNATREMHEYARLLGERLAASGRAVRVEVAFVAMASPALDEVLAQAASSATGQIVVQPHLLFGGVLAERIAGITRRCAEQYPDRRWVAADCLGPSAEVVAALVDRAGGN